MKLNKIVLIKIVILSSMITTNLFSQDQNLNMNKALLKAVKEGNIATVMALINAGADVNFLLDGQSSLHEAALYSPVNIINLLLESGASIDLKNGDGFTALSLAASKLRLEVIELLLLKGATNYKGAILSTADGFNSDLHDAYPQDIENAKKIVDLLLQKGADINEIDEDEATVLMKAMGTHTSGILWSGSTGYTLKNHYPIKFIQFLIDNGASINKTDNYGRTPLILAIQNLNMKAVELLLENNNLDLNQKDNSGMTALMSAITLNYNMRNKRLVNEYFKESWIHYHQYEKEYTFRELRQEILRWLVSDNRINVDLQNDNGRTALSLLVTFGWISGYGNMHIDRETDEAYKIEIIKMLLEKGSDININDQDGKSPLIYSVELGDDKIQNILIGSLYEASSIKIETYKKCWVVLINSGEAQKGQYGWWSVWHEKKEKREYFTTPYTFDNVLPGSYTIVIYDPASKPGEQSDGIVLKNIDIKENENIKYSFNKNDFKDYNCLCCPWLYIKKGSSYERLSEVIKDKVGINSIADDIINLQPENIINGIISIRLQEEKDEITYIDRIVLKVKDKFNQEINIFTRNNLLQNIDGDFLKLKKGESLTLDFNIPHNYRENSQITLHIYGYYDPDKKMLLSLFEQLSQK